MVWESSSVSFFSMQLSSFPNTFYWRISLFSIIYSCLFCHRLIDHCFSSVEHAIGIWNCLHWICHLLSVVSLFLQYSNSWGWYIFPFTCLIFSFLHHLTVFWVRSFAFCIRFIPRYFMLFDAVVSGIGFKISLTVCC